MLAPKLRSLIAFLVAILLAGCTPWTVSTDPIVAADVHIEKEYFRQFVDNARKSRKSCRVDARYWDRAPIVNDTSITIRFCYGVNIILVNRGPENDPAGGPLLAASGYPENREPPTEAQVLGAFADIESFLEGIPGARMEFADLNAD